MLVWYTVIAGCSHAPDRNGHDLDFQHSDVFAGRRQRVRTTLRAIIAVLAATTLTACGSSGTHTQAYSPAPTSHTPATTSATWAPETSVAPGSGSRSLSPIPVPTVSPAAQDAVAAYIALVNADASASLDPSTANLAELNRYLSGNALKIFDESYASMKAAGQAYRGSPPDPRVKVQSTVSPTFVYLTSCPLESPTDPSIEYYVASGQPVPTPSPRTPPPPYLLTLPMKLTNGQWQLTDVLQNVGKTCSG
ncbi:hypothetical protein SAMN05892883_2263 [Jatrophihabitans sp. GAS493]|nr:hypothetical protein SAMN05892883_2263 [Jatrophihabitans sp. GAS493]